MRGPQTLAVGVVGHDAQDIGPDVERPPLGDDGFREYDAAAEFVSEPAGGDGLKVFVRL